MRTAPFLQTQERFCGRTVYRLLPADRALEIDQPTDLLLADVLLRSREASSIHERLPKSVQALVLDFDGVLTDNKVYLNELGQESVRCDRGDGMGIGHVRAAGITVMILSKERNGVVQQRAKKLAIECYNAIDDKRSALQDWAIQNGIDLQSTIYVGNDLNDLDAMRLGR